MREAVVTFSDRDFDELGIGDLVACCRDAGIEDFEEVACHSDGAVVQVELASPLDPERIDSLSYVDRYEQVETSRDTHLYVIGFTAPALSQEYAAKLVGDCDATLTEYGVELSLVGPQKAIREAIAIYRDAGVEPELEKLGAYDGTDGPLDELTSRQREVIETAYEMGYYDVPRTTSTDAVAGELDVDPSTVAEHLQRAERNLLTRHFSTTL